jgi:DNA-binding transcriptional regulator LsrR (DeoR family)
MARVDELRLMTKVARLYYDENVGQREIAAQLDISQATVSRLIQRAQQERIVRISITPPQGVFADLESALEKQYALKEVVVVDCDGEREEDVLRNLGPAAGYYVETTVKPDEVIGVSSWSATLLSMVEAMHPLTRPVNAHVVQILGGVGNPAAEGHAQHLTSRLATLVRGQAHFLPAPGVLSSTSAMNVILNDPFVRETTALFEQVTMALVGIGSVEPSRLLASSGNVFSEQEIETLRVSGAVGDVCLRFYDAHGKPVITPLDKRVISMKLEQLRNVKRSVGIAGGERKVSAIRGALEGGWINVLITDRCTAEKLLQAAPEANALVKMNGNKR